MSKYKKRRWFYVVADTYFLVLINIRASKRRVNCYEDQKKITLMALAVLTLCATFMLPLSIDMQQGKIEITTEAEAATNGWVKVGSTWYYYKNGVKLTGFQWISGKLYRFNNGDGAMRIGHINLSTYHNLYYYAYSDGHVETGRKWIQSGNTWYYGGGSGQSYTLVTGWLKDGSYWYQMDAGKFGAMHRGWLSVGIVENQKIVRTDWYYLRTAKNVPLAGPDGAMLASCNAVINGKRYYFNASGLCTNP